MPSPGQFLLGVSKTCLVCFDLALYIVKGNGFSSKAFIKSINVESNVFNGTPFAATMKSKNDTSPIFPDGEFGCC